MNQFETFAHLALQYTINHIKTGPSERSNYAEHPQLTMQDIMTMSKNDVRIGIKVAAIIQNQKNKMQ